MPDLSAIKTAVIYARFSCSKQREASIEDQLRECRNWCAREGYAIVAEYTDYALSGRTDDRPSFQRMVSNAGESDIVLVYMMDRFSRNEYDAPIYKRELKKHGVEVVSAMESLPSGPEKILVEKIYEGLAAVESAKTSIRTKRGMEGNALKCMTNGVRVFGYKSDENDHYIIDEEQAAFVREAFARRLGGETVNSIARDFKLRGVKSAQGKPCSYNMMQKLLTNEKYTGVYVWGDIRVEGGMPKIIDRETFTMAGNVKASKVRKNENWGDYALAGKVLCAQCGHTMPGMSGRGRSNVKYEYYGCKKCNGVKPVRRDWLEIGIAEALREMLADDDTAKRIADIVAGCSDLEAETMRKNANRALKEAESGLKNIIDAIEKGMLVPGMQQRADELQAQKERAISDLALLDAEAIDPELFVEFLQFGATLDDEALLDAFVFQVMVSDEDVVVTLNFDAENNEPARLNIQRVRKELQWLPG